MDEVLGVCGAKEDWGDIGTAWEMRSETKMPNGRAACARAGDED